VTAGRARATRIGVTGHRAYLNEDSVRTAASALLDHLITDPGSTTLVSSLAEGADQMLAELALERIGATLTAVLPLERNEYVRDFATPDSVARFDELLGRATDVEVVSATHDVSRDEAYERAGRAMVDLATVVVAVWDGLPGRGRGGTAEIIDYARGAGRDVHVVHVERRAAS
jgi:hypothetical protein